MTITLRGDVVQVNATAQTSLVVNVPAGMQLDDFMLAFVFVADDKTITPPAGWVHRQTVTTAGTDARMAFYTRQATGSEPASYTWTLNVAERAWGYLIAYDGVDLAAPIVSIVANAFDSGGLFFTTSAVTQFPTYAQMVSVVGGRRTATGTGTTWTAFNTEQADFTSNNGSGVDVTGAAYDSNVGALDDEDSNLFQQFIASQTQADAITFVAVLRAEFVPFNPQARLDVRVEAAFGADPDGDPQTWTWQNISGYVRERSEVLITKGRSDEAGIAEPTRIALVLDNRDGRFTPTLASSPYFPAVVRNVPLRVSLTGFGATDGYERATGFVDEWAPGWDVSARDATVTLTASGRLRRLGQGAVPLHSLARRGLLGESPVASWPGEDRSGATRIGSAVGTSDDAQPFGSVSFAAADGPIGSDRLSTFPAGSGFTGTVRPFVPASPLAWQVVVFVNLPGAPAAESTFLECLAHGTLTTWRVSIAPNGDLNLRVFNQVGAQVAGSTLQTLGLHYDTWLGLNIEATQSVDQVSCDLTRWVAGLDGGLHDPDSTLGTLGHVHTVRLDATAGTAGMSAGHVAVYGSEVFLGFLVPDILSGLAGEEAVYRLYRLCGEENVPVQFPNPRYFRLMGPQPIATMLDLLRECEAVDGGRIHDGGPGGQLVLVEHDDRYNASIRLSVDVAAGHLAPGFAPTYDDQRIRNDVIVSRTGGSSARFTDTVSVTREGRYPNETTINSSTDLGLLDRAAWFVHVGTDADMRYPQLAWNLRASPELAEQWLGCAIGSRISVTNLPAQHPANGIAAFIEGYTERLGTHTWDVVANCSPAAPWQVAVIEGDNSPTAPNFRPDSRASTLASAVTTTATSLSVAGTGALWTVNDEPFDIDVAGERIQVTAVTGATSPQTFTVTRSTNAVIKAHSAGTTVRLWRPPALALDAGEV